MAVIRFQRFQPRVIAAIQKWWGYASVTVATVILLAPTLNNHILSYDEPAYLAQADRLGTFKEFVFAFYYRDETKSQIGLIPFRVALTLSTANSVMYVHLFGLLAILLSCLLVVSFTRYTVKSAIPGAATSLIWLSYLTIGPDPAFGTDFARIEFLTVLLEHFQIPLVLITMRLFVVTLLESRGKAGMGRLFLIGVVLSIATLIKPSLILLALVYIAFVVATPGTSASSAVRSIVSLGIDVTVPAVVVLGPYLFWPDALNQLKFNLVDLNLAYTAGDTIATRALSLLRGLPVPLVVLLLLSPIMVVLGRRSRLRGAATCGIVFPLVAGLSAFVNSLPGQAHLHYLVPVVLLIGLGVIDGIYLILDRATETGYRVTAVVLGVLLLGWYIQPRIVPTESYFDRARPDYYLDFDRQRFDLDRLVSYIQQNTSPDDRIWVYYDTPELYLMSDRRPATRDPDGGYLAQFWREPWFSNTAAELAKEQPKLIVGLDAPIWPSKLASSLQSIPRVDVLLNQAYSCKVGLVRGTTICTRHSGTTAESHPFVTVAQPY